jgi:rhodanese-related sulfurtransferase
MAMKRGYKVLLEEAPRVVHSVSATKSRAILDRDDVLFVDVREVRELERDGMIPHAFHAPRGMLEF